MPQKYSLSIAPTADEKARFYLHNLTWDELIFAVIDKPFSTSIFKNSYRNKANFDRAEMLGLDIDNDGNGEQLSLERAKELFKDYKHIIATTKSHQKEKQKSSGDKLPAADRFRVILFLSKPIGDSDVFTSTWFKLFERYPFIDQACKDASRYWNPSLEVVSTNENGVLVEPASPDEVRRSSVAAPVSADIADNEPKGFIAYRHQQFILNGAPDGEWNKSLYDAAKHLQQQRYSLEQAFRILAIPTALPGNAGSLDEKDIATIKSAYKEANKYEPHYPDQREDQREVFLNSIFLTDKDDPSSFWYYNVQTHMKDTFHPSHLPKYFNKEELESIRQKKTYVVSWGYNPNLNQILIKKEGNPFHVFNTYQPPPWRHRNFYYDEPIEPAPLPELYLKFLDHLTDGNEESREYVLDWLANMLQSRNRTVLATIGSQGVGKGILGDIIKNLVGEDNFVKTRDEVFRKSFNNQLKHKHAVYIDELAIETKVAYDRFKDIVNENISIEAKGKDEETVENHASYYVSSNNFTGLKIDEDDRRFSIIDLTDDKVPGKFSNKEIDDLTDSAHISQLARYLTHRKIARNMDQVFKSERSEQVKEANRKGWQLYLLEGFYKEFVGKHVSIDDVREEIRKQMFGHSPPSKANIENFIKQHAEMFRFYRDYDKTPSRWIEVIKVEQNQ